MKSMMKDAAILFAITLVAGLLLGCVYQVTKEPIRLAEEKAVIKAYAKAFTTADRFEKMEAKQQILAGQETGEFNGVQIDAVLRAQDREGNDLGYVLQITSREGYGGDITFTMGIGEDGTCNGISILAMSETPGLGMNAEAVLLPQFAGKKEEAFSLTKEGAAANSQIDVISGATITSDALVTAVNGGLYYFRTELQKNQ